MKITSKNLIYRNLMLTDADNFYDILGNPKAMDPIPLKIYSRTESDAHLIELINKNEIDILAITLKENEDFIGFCAILRDNEIVYRLRPSFWGKGYGTEAVETFINYSFSELKKEYIIGEANKTNIPSVKILSKFLNKTEEYFNKELNCTNIKFKKMALNIPKPNSFSENLE
jgi:RimJ/RimL family protein N-acetyltransferase